MAAPELRGAHGAIARAARIYFGGAVVGILLEFAAIAARANWIGTVASFVLSLTSIPLILAVRPALPARDPRLPLLITSVGLTASALALVNAIGTAVGVGGSPVGTLVGLLNAGWLVLVGLSRPSLPAPLPRRAILGGAGAAVIVFWGLLDRRSPLAFAVALVGIVLAIQALGFLFGLMDLDHPRPDLAQ